MEEIKAIIEHLVADSTHTVKEQNRGEEVCNKKAD